MLVRDGVGSRLAGVRVERLRRDIFTLAADPFPRRTLNSTVPGHTRSTLDEVDDWLEEELRSAGYGVVREGVPVQAFGIDYAKPLHHRYARPAPDDPWYTAHNLYAEQPGSERPDEIVLLLAHKDSQSWIASPGAYDNAVGTAAVLELARVLATVPTRRTFRFLFCNEEHTPWTSVTAARRMQERADNLVAIFNLDSLGGKSDEAIAAGRKTNVTLYTTPERKRLADLMVQVIATYGIGLEQTAVERPRPSDDDGSFVRAGYGAAVANIGSFPYADAEYHLEGDRPERVDVENVCLAAQATLAAVLTLDAGEAP